MTDTDLLSRLKDYVEEHPGKTASVIAKELKVTRKEVNSLLYKGNRKIFMRIDHGEKAPTWQIFNPNIRLNSHESALKLPPKIESPDKVAITKVLDSIDSQLEDNNSLRRSIGDLSFEVLLVEEGANSNYCRFEVLEVDDLIIIINQDHYLNKVIKDRSQTEIVIHLFHCIADCLAQYKMKRTSVQEEEFIPIKTDYFRRLLSLDIQK